MIDLILRVMPEFTDNVRQPLFFYHSHSFVVSLFRSQRHGLSAEYKPQEDSSKGVEAGSLSCTHARNASLNFAEEIARYMCSLM